jgi:hypothetical protein
MNRSLAHRLDQLAHRIGTGCPACRHLSPHVVIVRRRADEPEPDLLPIPCCTSCGHERNQTVIVLTRVERWAR